jgi:hypothetical protein
LQKAGDFFVGKEDCYFLRKTVIFDWFFIIFCEKNIEKNDAEK